MRTLYSRGLVVPQCILLLIILLSNSHSLKAQFNLDSLSIDSLYSLGYDPVVRIYDEEGDEYHPLQLQVPNITPTPIPAPPSTGSNASVCNCGVFRLYYEDVIQNTGQGFDDQTAYTGTGFPLANNLGEVRQIVLCQAFEDLSNFITPVSTTTTVNIQVQLSGGNTNQFLGSAQSYYTVPGPVNGAILDNQVWKVINTGIDPYNTWPTGTLNNSLYHGRLTFNFDKVNRPYFYNYNSSAIAQTETDMYSVALHEAIHLLGFSSLIRSDGFSIFTSPPGFPGCDRCYSRYDGNIDNPNNTPASRLIGTTNINQPTYNGLSNHLAGGCSSSIIPLEYNTANVANQVIYSENPFMQGTSISHFECNGSNPAGYNGALYASTPTGPNSIRRSPNQEEVNVLCDLGYTRSNSYAIGTTVIRNYTSCSSNPCIPAGVNDAQFSNGQRFVIDQTVSTDITIPFADLVSNDIGNGAINVSNINPTAPGGALTIGGNDLTYTPNANTAGWVILSYYPQCSTTGELGNITYIFIFVLPATPACNQTNCNLICNGGLEDNRYLFHRGVDLPNLSNQTIFYRLSSGIGTAFSTWGVPIQTLVSLGYLGGNTPHCINGTPLPLPPPNLGNTTYGILTASNVSGGATNLLRHAIKFNLTQNLIPTHDYTLTFFAQIDPSCTPPPNPIVEVYGVTGDPFVICNNPNVNLPNSTTLFNNQVNTCGANNFTTQYLGQATVSNVQGTWQQYTITIPASTNPVAGMDHLIVTLQDLNGAAPNSTTATYVDEFELLDNTVSPVTITATPTNPFPCLAPSGPTIVDIEYEVCLGAGAVSNTQAVVLDVDLPAGVTTTFMSDFDAQGQLTIPAGGLTSACSTYTLQVLLPSGTTAGTPISFPIQLANTATCLDVDASALTATVTPITGTPLSISKTVSTGPYQIGQPITYSITVCNFLPAAVNNIRVVDVFPTELTMVTPNGFVQQGNGNWRQDITLPAAINGNPSCTTLTFVAAPNNTITGCEPTRIRNRARARIRQTSCDVATTPFTDIFVSGGGTVAIPPTVITLNNAIAQGYLLPIAQALNTAQKIYIEDQLIIDLNDKGGTQYYFASGSEIIMGPGAEIIVSGEAVLDLYGTHVHGCNQMWRRILVENGGVLRIYDNSLVEDGEYAIWTNDRGNITLHDSRFNNNYVGWHAPPSTTPKRVGHSIGKLTTFESNGTFLPKYPGQTTTPDQFPFAGIEVHDLLNEFRINNSTFRNLANGILLFNTNASITGNMDINGMQTVNSYTNPSSGVSPFSSIGIYSESLIIQVDFTFSGVGGTANDPIVIQDANFGIGLSGSINFTIVKSHLENFDFAAIAVRGAQNCIGAINDNYIELVDPSFTGLFLGANDPMASLDISRNTIVADGGNNPIPPTAIRLLENGILHKPIISDNTIRLRQARTGIELINQNGAIVSDNDIQFINFNPGGFLGFENRVGIRTNGSSNQRIDCNVITGDHPLQAYTWALVRSREVYGIRAGQSSNMVYGCNQFDQVPTGIRVDGISSSSVVRGNRFDQVGRALFWGASSSTGSNLHTGNRFVWQPPSLTAFPPALRDFFGLGIRNDNVNAPSTSLFKYDINVNTDFAPFGIHSQTAGNWYQNDPTSQVTFNCNNPTLYCGTNNPIPLVAGGGNPPSLNATETATINNTFAPAVFPITTRFEIQCLTYAKLKENPSLAPTGSIAASFVQQCDQAPAGTFYQLDQQCPVVLQLDTSQSQQVQQWQQQMDIGLANLTRLDSLWQVDSLHRDSFALLRQQQATQLQPLWQQRHTFWQNYWQARVTASQGMWGQNNGLTTNIRAEQNLQTVNGIYFQSFAKGIWDLTPSQIQSLDAIARQCPLERGVAVYKARSMVQFYTRVDYERLQNCNSSSRNSLPKVEVEEEEVVEQKGIALYPNPTSKGFVTHWSYDKADKHRKVLVYNALGQLVLQQNITDRKTYINTTTLVAGLYHCSFWEDGKIQSTKKLIISKE